MFSPAQPIFNVEPDGITDLCNDLFIGVTVGITSLEVGYESHIPFCILLNDH